MRAFLLFYITSSPHLAQIVFSLIGYAKTDGDAR